MTPTFSNLTLIAVSNAELLMPPWLTRQWNGAPLWAWLALPLVWVGGALISRLLGWLACRAAKQADTNSRWRRLIEEAKTPAQVVVAIVLFRIGREALPLPAGAALLLRYAELAAATFATLWLLLRAASVASDYAGNYLSRSGRRQARAMVPLLRKTLKTGLVLFAFIFLLQNAGIDVAAILAGLGIGGLAIALAGQKTVENLFGGIALTIDQPARVGEFCKFDKVGGTIEDIGLRSTRVRTADRTLVTIPNSKLSEMTIENFASRGRILLQTTISLSLQTRADQLEAVLEGIRGIIAARGENCQGARVCLVAFTSTSYDVEIFTYVNTTDFEQFLAIREAIYLETMRLLERADVQIGALLPPIIAA